MEVEKAYNIIEESLDMANKKGAFDLQTSAIVFAALKTLQTALAPKKAEPETDGK